MTGLTPSAKRPLLHVSHEQSSGVAGGTLTSGAFRTVPLNTVKVNEIAGASVASNQITLPAGDYEFYGRTIARMVDSSRARLYDTTGAAELGAGASFLSTSSDIPGEPVVIEGRFSLGATSVLEFQVRPGTTRGTDGFGAPASLGVAEVYAGLEIWKV